MMIAAGFLLMMIGHLIRDGYPSLGVGRTFWARLLGALFCAAGGWCLGPWPLSTLLGAAVGLGFWTDFEHAEGQRARDWADAGWLIVSGMTSLILVAAVLIFAHWNGSPALIWGVVVIVGVLKAPIWFLCWQLVPEGKVFQPTRVAAVLWGATMADLVWVFSAPIGGS